MEVGLLPTINSQLINLDRANGSDALAHDVVRALERTVATYKGDTSTSEMMIEFLHLYDLLLACRPRMANLILDIQKTILYIHDHPNASPKKIRAHLLGLLDVKNTRTGNVISSALPLFTEPKSILLHSYSSTLVQLLRYYALKGLKHRIFVAAQEKEKTGRLIKFLHKYNFEYSVVSEFSVSHVLNEVDFAIFGALTINTHRQLILGPGSSSLISQLNKFGVDTYVILTTNKFSFWEEETETAYKEIRLKRSNEITYHKNVFSHDHVKVEIATGIITESCITTPHEILDLFGEMQSQFFTNEQIIRHLWDDKIVSK